MLMISHANTNPGLTKTWDAGEPAKYFPSGKRSYGRVVTTDDIQGPAAAQFAAKDLKVTKCFVLNDTETYGQGVAKTFAEEAKKQGITVVGETSWKKGDANYTALFGQAKAAGADCVRNSYCWISMAARPLSKRTIRPRATSFSAHLLLSCAGQLMVSSMRRPGRRICGEVNSTPELDILTVLPSPASSPPRLFNAR